MLSRKSRRSFRLLNAESLESRNLLASITLPATRDTSLYENNDGTLSNGQGEYLFAGKTNQGGAGIRRAMLLFDVSQVPANATITSASLRLNVSRSISEAAPMSLHRIQSDWGEAASNARDEEGKGIDALPGDSTWLHRQFPSTNWNTPGGDFVSTASDTTDVAGVGAYTWSSAGMISDIQAWSQDPSTNFGWILLGDESTKGTAKQIGSRENSTEANRPSLTIEYDVAATSTLSIADASVAEGNDGITTLDIPVTLSQAVSQAVTVKYKLNAGTASVDTDFLPAEGTLTFEPNGPLVKNVSIEIVGDRVTEANETLTIELSEPSGSSIERSTATVTIQNDDQPPSISIGDISVTEGNEGTTVATLTVSLDHASDFPITVQYATEADSATAEADYQTSSGQVSFEAGQVSSTIDVSVVGDTSDEQNEAFKVRLTAPINSQLADESAAIEIVDDDTTIVSPWRNAAMPQDVSGDGQISPLDALLIINRLNSIGPGRLPEPSDETSPPPYFDVDGDNELAPIDAMIVINYLNDNPVEVTATAARPQPINSRTVDRALIALAFEDWLAEKNET